MDNIQKALTMAASALLFIIAASVTVILYSGLIENTKNIIVASDSSRNSSEQAITSSVDSVREIKSDEVILTILNMENEKSFVDAIVVNGQTFYIDTDGKLEGDLSRVTGTYTKVTYDNSIEDYKVLEFK